MRKNAFRATRTARRIWNFWLIRMIQLGSTNDLENPDQGPWWITPAILNFLWCREKTNIRIRWLLRRYRVESPLELTGTLGSTQGQGRSRTGLPPRSLLLPDHFIYKISSSFSRAYLELLDCLPYDDKHDRIATITKFSGVTQSRATRPRHCRSAKPDTCYIEAYCVAPRCLPLRPLSWFFTSQPPNPPKRQGLSWWCCAVAIVSAWRMLYVMR